jgi:tRNA A37 threonylcarbamoyltransferase TsaD
VEGRARLTIPSLALCTDNAAMIAAAAHHAPSRNLDVDPDLAW